ncbi:hypothetical protein NXC12_PD00248 (plasmid) [Rhizobium etli]|uniref:Nif11 domain-containing protein n=2 Tax=Rhizobium etli TaxID=29449 RepID=A0AAN1BLL0_RHIET|nr:Nif11-like leader peptide family natural product precursor [Rhizobium sp. NXC14]ARO32600.1 hypothetical protein NXC14_PA00329 [Rhizobium sp. NXC14]ARQ13343.1 hypothetical protein NXC12_PD00248 [Rhizobium etli]
MPQSEVERFVDGLAKDGAFLEKLKPNATGLASVLAIAKNHGYNFTLDEAKNYIQSRSQRELIDKPLGATFGGKHDPNVATSTMAVQTAAVVTTAVEAAEAATSVLEAVEAVVFVVAVLI